MLSPLDLQNNKVVTKKRKYDKAEMDEYLELVFENYKALFDEHQELEKEVKSLREGIQYYRSIESTMQKALVLAEKTSKETKDAAILKAEAIEKDAQTKASNIISEAEQEYEKVKEKCLHLMQQFNQYKLQLKQVATAQLDLITSESFDVAAPELESLQQTKTVSSENKKETKPVVKPEVKESPITKETIIDESVADSDIADSAVTDTPVTADTLQKNELLVDESVANEPNITETIEVEKEPEVNVSEISVPVEEKAQKTSSDLEKTVVLPDIKPELAKRKTLSKEDDLSILTADTIDLSDSIRKINQAEEENNIQKPIKAEPKEVQDALVINPVDAKTSIPLDAELKEVKVKKKEVLEPPHEESKSAPTLDSLLQSMNMSSKKNKKKGQEEDPFEFLGSVDDF